jgi:pilus assembly protein CpaF
MLQAMNTGHDGSLTTLHAGTPEEAVLRLVLMARFGMDLPAALIEEQVATALDLLVLSARRPDGTRRITSLSEVRRASTGGVELRELVAYDGVRDVWTLVAEPDFLEQALFARRVTREEVARWRDLASSSARAA